MLLMKRISSKPLKTCPQSRYAELNIVKMQHKSEDDRKTGEGACTIRAESLSLRPRFESDPGPFAAGHLSPLSQTFLPLSPSI